MNKSLSSSFNEYICKITMKDTNQSFDNWDFYIDIEDMNHNRNQIQVISISKKAVLDQKIQKEKEKEKENKSTPVYYNKLYMAGIIIIYAIIHII
jgi:hypothetical protein